MIDSLFDIFNLNSEECLNRIKGILQSGVDVNHSYDNGWTLLHYSCEHRQIATIDHLLAVGASSELRNDEGWCPIHMAVDGDIDFSNQQGVELNFECAKLIIKNGVDLSLMTSDGETALDIISGYGEAAVNEYNKVCRREW